MSTRNLAWTTLMTVAGLLGAYVSFDAIYAAIVIDLRVNPILTASYCLLPILCFPVFLFVHPARRAAWMLATLAAGYLAAFAALNWRTCSEFGYCANFAQTLLVTFKTRRVLAFFAVAIITFMADLLNS